MIIWHKETVDGWGQFFMLWEPHVPPLFMRLLLCMIQNIKIYLMMTKDCNTFALFREKRLTRQILPMVPIMSLDLIICGITWLSVWRIRFKEVTILQ